MPTLPFKLNQDRRHPIPKQKHKVTNSAAYDAALRRRGSLTVWFTDEAVTAWTAEPRTNPGRTALVLAPGDLDGTDAQGRVPSGAATDRGADRFHHPPARARSGGPGPHDAYVDGSGACCEIAGVWVIDGWEKCGMRREAALCGFLHPFRGSFCGFCHAADRVPV